jgi:uncharacterized membrane protein YoaK (UPF0700 family)
VPAARAEVSMLLQHVPTVSFSQRHLPALLAVIAGMVDLTGFLDLGHVFTAHITGNLVVLAAVAVRGRPVNVAQLLAIPAFVLTVAAVWLLARATTARSDALTRRLLFVQFLMLGSVLVLCVVTRPSADPHGLMAGIAVLVAASAMACQNALLHMSANAAPSTAVMTGNLVSAVLSGLDALSRDPAVRSRARRRFGAVWPLLLGFLAGCSIAAAAVSRVEDWAWSLPAGMAGLAALLPWTADVSPSGRV